MNAEILFVNGLVCWVMADLSDMRGKRTRAVIWMLAGFVAAGRAIAEKWWS